MTLKELDRKEIGIRIRDRREFLQISKEELADRMGVSLKTINNIEYGERGMSVKNLYALKQTLGISIDYILEGGEVVPNDDKRKMLNENIMGSLSVCSVKQLKCMEQMARIYVEGVVNNK